jgi:hypothetical protein
MLALLTLIGPLVSLFVLFLVLCVIACVFNINRNVKLMREYMGDYLVAEGFVRKGNYLVRPSVAVETVKE